MTIESERIVAAAIKIGDLVISMQPPARHHSVLHQVNDNLLQPGDLGIAEQGFLTSDGRFVDRITARKLAFMADQIGLRKRTVPQDTLFSEDLW